VACFLFKTEPDVYSFDDFLRDKETVWDNVTNPTAVKFLREMKAGRNGSSTTRRRAPCRGTGVVVSVDGPIQGSDCAREAGKRLKRRRLWLPSRQSRCLPSRRW